MIRNRKRLIDEFSHAQEVHDLMALIRYGRLKQILSDVSTMDQIHHVDTRSHGKKIQAYIVPPGYVEKLDFSGLPHRTIFATSLADAAIIDWLKFAERREEIIFVSRRGRDSKEGRKTEAAIISARLVSEALPELDEYTANTPRPVGPENN